MGQYYKFIILNDTKKNNKEVIIFYMKPHDYMHGAKLMEHSYFDIDFLNTVESILSKEGDFYKSRIVWAGDYADDEDDSDENLYRLAEKYTPFTMVLKNRNIKNKYIVNHTKKLYTPIEQKSSTDYKIHPLPLLVSEGNGRGGGDYDGNNSDMCGSWARDVISIEEEIPENYTELECNFD
jgi:hypothetical protein